MNITIVTVCVNYLDILKISYYFNKKNINQYNYHIITTQSDYKTQEFCKENKINYWTTDIFYKNGNKFNKGAALNIFFKEYIAKYANNLEWIAKIDSDIIVNNTLQNFMTAVSTNSLEKFCTDPMDSNYMNYFYSCPRRIFNTPNDFTNGSFYVESKVDFIGYFQLFHVSKIKDDLLANKSIFHEHHNACRYDDIFATKYWPNRNQRKTFGSFVDHLGPIATNWDGRKSEPWDSLHKYLI